MYICVYIYIYIYIYKPDERHAQHHRRLRRRGPLVQEPREEQVLTNTYQLHIDKVISITHSN